MKYQIENAPVFSTLRVILDKGESIRAEAGAMVSMSSSIELEAKTAGQGLFGTLKAAVGGESFFAALYTATRDNSELVLAPAVLGDITVFELKGNTIFAQSGAYLAGSNELQLSTQGSFKALISGEGLFLQKISGNGVVFLSSYGAIIEKKLAPGETYRVDTGHIVAFEESVQYHIKKAAKGLFASFASGEGLVGEYRGPGTIWLQTRNLPAFANVLARFLPHKNND
ncbi:MAG TPA: TIGR00266 family protein [Bacillota bacterium]|nr:TIGR00266 family protein [Bacillota bacterium]HOL10225.1 TIGR00266 family protein [Bacillota bacterium]HPO98015.1 TIGR00266 family protein [Bacillota bacterium]